MFLLLERVLPAAIEHYQDEERFREIIQGVTALSSILRPFAEAAARETSELEDEREEKTV